MKSYWQKMVFILNYGMLKILNIMNPIRLIYIKDLTYKHEIFLRKPPRLLIWFIYLITSFIIVTFLYCYFGKMEEVIRVKGKIRPIQNISLVKNITSGEIKNINYEPGQKVKKGDVLLKIDDSVYLSKKIFLEVHYKEINRKIEGIKKLIKSFNDDKNLLKKDNLYAFSRFAVYESERDALKKRYNRLKTLQIEANALPPTAIKRSKLNEMKYQTDMAKLNLITYKNKFIRSLILELDELLLQKEEINSQLKDACFILENTTIVSPISGYIQETSSLNKGDYIYQGQSILNIIPDGQKFLKIELKVPAKDAGKIVEGLKVKIRFSAFPYHEFGGAEGRVVSINPDSYIDKKGTVYFIVTASINKSILLDKAKNKYIIKPGFEVETRIILKEQSILWYFFKRMDLIW